MFNRNIITAVDSYKLSQYLQVSDNIQYFYSYIESRGGIYDATMVAGIVPVLKEWFVGKVVTQEKIEEAAENMGIHISCLSRFCSEKNPEYDHILV